MGDLRGGAKTTFTFGSLDSAAGAFCAHTAAVPNNMNPIAANPL